ncbi:diguanylate cyclase [Herbaspirillum sp. RTI4]|uniref:diguanylate cyclase domain-containing protein n=1 Tax=Herbaspirillum sp. RTI4 TaxID=3048640 RepID=UPI002AB50A15|nr:diguanylate cyclase [Herbaspirillum sp. RTI4]MDY7578211.1 diguanylate cyclase [Herbaspirillum sp. RTI4]MEA9981549.1 diguanylate cyclase [Herbaspirillum sp. RTI4]
MHTIKFRLAALTLALLAIGFLFRVFFAVPYAESLLRDVATREQSSIATYIARDVDQRLTARHAFLSRLSASLPSEELQRPAALSQWLKERQQLNPLFSLGLLVLTPDGRLLADYPSLAKRAKQNFVDERWFRKALNGDVHSMSQPQYGRASGKPVLIMAVPVRDTEQRVVAVLAGVVELNAPGFLDLFQDTRFSAHGGILLISAEDKLFVASSDPAMVLKSTPASGINLLHDRAMAGFRGTETTISTMGVEKLSTVASVPGTDWFVVVHVPLEELFQPLRTMSGFFFKATVGLLALLLLILFLSLPYILKPLLDAAHAMRDMADGKRALEPLHIRRKDEVGYLVIGFNYLIGRLREQDAALKASEGRLEYMAHNDSLTGLYNRAYLEDRLKQALEKAERDGSRFVLLFCDLDDFKPINDRFGHEAGDATLREVGKRLLQGRRRVDIVARFGGDEFVVLLADVDAAVDVGISVARQILSEIGMPLLIEGHTFRLAASIGIAISGGVDVTAAQLLARADTAMYRAKRAGKNQFWIFDEEGVAVPGQQTFSPDVFPL